MHEFLVVRAGEKSHGYLEATSFAPPAAIVTSGLRSAECFLQESVGVERRLLRSHTAGEHLTLTGFADDAENDRRMYVLLSQQKIGCLGDRIAILVTQVTHTGDRVIVAHE